VPLLALANYGFLHCEMASFLFPNFSFLFPICATYFTSTSVPPANPFAMNGLRTGGLGMELA